MARLFVVIAEVETKMSAEGLEESLRSRLAENASDYDAYRELLSIPTISADEKLHLFAEFQKAFPLDEPTWLAWIDLLGETNHAVKAEILELALNDYLSIRLIVEYCQHVFGTSADWRSRFSHCASIYGSHYTQGHLIWDAWLAREREVNEDKKKEEYVMRRRATSPLENVALYWDEYAKAFPYDFASHEVSFKQSLKQVEERKPFEDALHAARGGMEEVPGSPLTASNGALEAQWVAYMENEKTLHPKKKQNLLFERAIADCCLSVLLWERYIQEVEISDTVAKDLPKLCTRALRNIPSGSSLIFAASIRGMAVGSSFASAKEIFEKAKHALTSLADLIEPALALVMAAKKYGTAEDVKRACHDTVSLLSKTAKRDESTRRACSTILRSLPLEASSWDKLSTFDTAQFYWPDYLAIAQTTKTPEDMRGLYNKALHASYSDLLAFDFVASRWLAYELEKGEFSDYIRAKQAIDQKREKSVSKKKPVALAGKERAPAKKETIKVARVGEPENKKMRKMSVEVDDESSVPEKQSKKPSSNKNESKSQRKDDDVSENDDSKSVIDRKKIKSGHNVVFLPSLPDTATSESVKDFFQRLVKVDGAFVDKVQIKTRANLLNPVTKESLTKLYAFVEFGGESLTAKADAALKATKLSGSDLDGFDVTILMANPPSTKQTHQPQRDHTQGGHEPHQMDVEGEAKPTNVKPRSLLVPRAVKVATVKKPVTT